MADSIEKESVTGVTEQEEEVTECTEEEIVIGATGKDVVTSSDQNQESTGTEMENSNQASKVKRARKAKLSQLTRRKNIMIQLMEDVSGLNEVRENLHTYKDLFEKFKTLQENDQELLTEEERQKDVSEWFEPKIYEMNTFLSSVYSWISGASGAVKPQEEEITPKDSVSQVSSRGSRSTTASVRLREEAERAAILVKMDALEEKHALEEKENALQSELQALK